MSRARSGSMIAPIAGAVWDALVEHAGASTHEDARHEFVFHQTRDWLTEFRFGGLPGFGGKFYRNFGIRPDGSHGERWYVSAYREDIDRRPERSEIIATTNTALDLLRADHETSQT